MRAAQVEVEAVRPDPASPAEELRLRVALLPVRVRADQRVCEFLAAFFAPPDDTVLVPSAPAPPPAPAANGLNNPDRPAAQDDGRDAEGAIRWLCCVQAPVVTTDDDHATSVFSEPGGACRTGPSWSMPWPLLTPWPLPRQVMCQTLDASVVCAQAEVRVSVQLLAAQPFLQTRFLSLGAASAIGGEPFIQRAEIQAWSVTIDYKPRRLDVAALRQGAFLEVRPARSVRLAW